MTCSFEVWRRVWRLANVMTFVLLIATTFPTTFIHAQDSPFFLRDTKENSDLGAYNQNNRDLAVRPGSRLTQTVTPTSCPAGQALTGGVFQHGQTWGGTCTAVASSNSTNVFNSSVTFNGGVFGTINASTWTFLSANYSGTHTVGVALDGSTITYTSQGTRISLKFAGGYGFAQNAYIYCTICMDGSCSIPPYSDTAFMYNFTNAENSSSGGSIIIDAESRDAISSGSHTFYFSCSNPATNTPRIDCSVYPCLFKISDIH